MLELGGEWLIPRVPKKGPHAEAELSYAILHHLTPLLPTTRPMRLTPTDVSQFVRLEQCERFLRFRIAERAGQKFVIYRCISMLPPLFIAVLLKPTNLYKRTDDLSSS